MPFPWLAAAGVAASIGSSMVTNSGSKRSQRRANKHNVNFWNMQNEYNNPTSQMQRLRDAGLNPNLIYGSSSSGAAGNAEKIAPSKASPYKMNDPGPAASNLPLTKQINATTDNLKTQNTVILQEKLLKANQTLGVGADNALKMIGLGVAPALAKGSLSIQQANIRKLESDALGSEYDTYFKSQTIKDRIKDIGYRMQISLETKKGAILKNEMLEWENQLKEIGLDRSDPFLIKMLGRRYQQWLKKHKPSKVFKKIFKN